MIGKSLLIWPEQGYGDYVQFARYMPLLKKRGVSQLTLVCAAALSPVLASVEGVDLVVTDVSLITAHDYWCFPLSLPLHFGTTIDNIPVALPYVKALPARIKHWYSRLPQEGIKIGLVWKGNVLHENDANRSLPGLGTLAPLWQIPGVRFVSLQKWQGEEEAKQTPENLPLIALGTDIMDFADTAAIVTQLDLVICVDTAIAHIAGALGKPCWVLLPATGTDWRWLLERTDSPWYPDVLRLFRQTNPGDWSEVIGDVAAALASWVEAFMSSKQTNLSHSD